MLKKMIEYKIVDWAIAEEDLDSDGIIKFIPTIAEGDGGNERSGQEVFATRLTLRGRITKQGNGSDGLIRMLLVRMKKKDATITGQITDFLTATSITSPHNQPNRDNYKIYYDETFAIDEALRSNIPFYITQKLKSRIRYNADTVGNENDCVENPLYFIAFSNIATGADCPHLYVQGTLSYTDL